MTEDHAHGFDAWHDSPGPGSCITDDRSADSVHDEPDVGFDAADLDVSLIRDKRRAGTVVIMVHKRFDADGGCLTVVCDLLTGNRKPVQFFQCLGCFSQGELKVYVQRKTEPHDMSIILTETQGRCILRKLVERHFKEIDAELAIEIMQLVVAFPVWCARLYLLQIILIVGAFGIHAFPDGKELPVLDRDERAAAERTADLKFFTEACLTGRKSLSADFALVLSVASVVAVKIVRRSSAAGAPKVFGDGGSLPAFDRGEDTPVMGALVLFSEMPPVFVTGGNDGWQDVCFELFVLRRARIIVSPLL